MNLFKKAKDRYKSAKLVNEKRLTLKAVNNAIKAHFPDVTLVKGEGYFYLVGDTDEVDQKLNQLQSTSIYVYKLNEQSLAQWLLDVQNVLAQVDSSMPTAV